jgi:hypothetical protein
LDLPEIEACFVAEYVLFFYLEWFLFPFYRRTFQMKRFAVGAFALTLIAVSSVSAGGLKSGPQEGSNKIPAFNPTHCNGKFTDQAVCLV